MLIIHGAYIQQPAFPNKRSSLSTLARCFPTQRLLVISLLTLASAVNVQLLGTNGSLHGIPGLHLLHLLLKTLRGHALDLVELGLNVLAEGETNTRKNVADSSVSQLGSLLHGVAVKDTVQQSTTEDVIGTSSVDSEGGAGKDVLELSAVEEEGTEFLRHHDDGLVDGLLTAGGLQEVQFQTTDVVNAVEPGKLLLGTADVGRLVNDVQQSILVLHAVLAGGQQGDELLATVEGSVHHLGGQSKLARAAQHVGADDVVVEVLHVRFADIFLGDGASSTEDQVGLAVTIGSHKGVQLGGGLTGAVDGLNLNTIGSNGLFELPTQIVVTKNTNESGLATQLSVGTGSGNRGAIGVDSGQTLLLTQAGESLLTLVGVADVEVLTTANGGLVLHVHTHRGLTHEKKTRGALLNDVAVLAMFVAFAEDQSCSAAELECRRSDRFHFAQYTAKSR
ncbi:5-methyltetrahydrofolate--homocysteine methyltransferase, putative [Babesia ovata]|uniref:5-methyltetrahydrofolate--homocysteine methyltransferase, putative n=1 Tax=Babesia ovata TaxID=189622 RepID=A0A2H6KDT3_9APIC|nr:5-methyltetrahydrofolate--homocysteine methyltransferase, putative [Babesia ovata]GBE61147.1 5-methyltetrahydrofolate--homocysteine methyltransferase, putative [Babesia ovata]